MPLKTSVGLSSYDLAEHLAAPSDVRHLLEAAFEDGDPAVITAALGSIARSQGMTIVAERAGLTRESLYKALSPAGNPEFRTVVKVLTALGLRLTTKRRQPVGRRSRKADEATDRTSSRTSELA